MQIFLSIVIPVYNEVLNIEKVIEDHVHIINELEGKIDTWEIVCLDDASTDKTYSLLQDISTKIPQLRIIKNPTNLGITRSFLRLFNEAQGTHIYVTGGDGQWPASNLKGLLIKLIEQNADIIVGVRQDRLKVYGFWRNILSYGFNMFARILFGFDTKDANGVKLGRKDIFNLPVNSSSFFSEIERLIVTKKLGYTIAYCSVSFLPRLYGKEKGSSLKNLMLTLRDMLSYKIKNLI